MSFLPPFTLVLVVLVVLVVLAREHRILRGSLPLGPLPMPTNVSGGNTTTPPDSKSGAAPAALHTCTPGRRSPLVLVTLMQFRPAALPCSLSPFCSYFSLFFIAIFSSTFCHFLSCSSMVAVSTSFLFLFSVRILTRCFPHARVTYLVPTRGTSAPLARATSAISAGPNPIPAMASAQAKTCCFSAPIPGKGCTFRALFSSSGRAQPYFAFR